MRNMTLSLEGDTTQDNTAMFTYRGAWEPETGNQEPPNVKSKAGFLY